MGNSICNICGSTAAVAYSTPVDYISGERFMVVRCQNCSLIYVHPQPLAADLGRYYPAGHQQADPAFYEKMDAKARVNFVRKAVAVGPGRALDVGCGKGLFLIGLRELGWQVCGTELSEQSSAFARNSGLSVYTKAIEDAPFEDGSFDLITLFHVLEHLPQPLDTLVTAFSLLRPGGAMLVEVPNIGSWYARVFGDNWFHYDVPRHLFHFNPETLHRIVSAAGFHISRTETRNIQYDAFGAVQSFLNSVLAKPNLLNNFNTRQTTFRELWATRDRIANLTSLAVSELSLAIGFPAMALLGLVLSPWVDGGTLRILASKPALSVDLSGDDRKIGS